MRILIAFDRGNVGRRFAILMQLELYIKQSLIVPALIFFRTIAPSVDNLEHRDDRFCVHNVRLWVYDRLIERHTCVFIDVGLEQVLKDH